MKITPYFAPVAAAAFLIATTNVASAQQSPMGASQAQQQQEMEKQLGITTAQKAKLETINKKYQPKVTNIQKKYAPQAQALQKQMQALQQKMQALNQKAFAEAKPTLEARQKEIDGVLTATQKAKIKQLQAAQMQGGMGR